MIGDDHDDNDSAGADFGMVLFHVSFQHLAKDDKPKEETATKAGPSDSKEPMVRKVWHFDQQLL